jgi:hypothetical protein
MAWAEFQPAEAAACLPVIVGLLIAGVLTDLVVPAMVASTGAFVVGFGAFQTQFRDTRVPMLTVTVSTSISAAIGTLANAWLPVELLCGLLWGTVVGLMNIVGQGPGWIALQTAIALLIAASFPATPGAALERFALVIAGAAAQLCFVLLLRAVLPRALPRGDRGSSMTLRRMAHEGRDILTRRRPGIGYALITGAAVMAADLIANWSQMPNGYWIGMTVLFISRPVFSETRSRAGMRLVGTTAGAGLMTVVMVLTRPATALLIVLIGLACWAAYALLRVNYALLSFAVTAYVVLLFALSGMPEPVVALHRTVATCVGGAIALAAHALCVRFAVCADNPTQ